MHLTYILKSIPYSQQVNISVFFEASPFIETKETSGYAHFLEHMIFEGSENFPKSEQVVKEINKLGGEFGGSTYSDFTVFDARAYYKNVNRMLEIVSDALFNPLLESRMVEKEKTKILTEFKNLVDNTAWYSTALFEQEIAKGHPLSFGVSALGTEATIKKVNQAILREYHEKYYQKSKALVVIAGNLKFLDEELFKKLFVSPEDSHRSNPQAFVPIENKGKNIKLKNSELDYLRFGFWSEKSNKSHYLIQEFAADILNNELQKYFRQDRGVAYSAYASLADYVSGKYYYAEVDVENKYTKEAIEKVFEIVKTLDISKDLFEIVRGRMLDMHILEYTQNIAHDIGFSKLRGREYKDPKEAILKIEKITIDEVRAEVKKLQYKLKSCYITVGA